MTATLAATTIAAPMPEGDLSVSGSGDLDVNAKRDEYLHVGAGGKVGISGSVMRTSMLAAEAKSVFLGSDTRISTSVLAAKSASL